MPSGRRASGRAKRVELHLFVVLARVQRLEVRHAVDTKHHGLTIDDELPDTVLQRGFDDPGVAVGPVVPALCDEAHAITVTLQAGIFTEEMLSLKRVAVLDDISWFTLLEFIR